MPARRSCSASRPSADALIANLRPLATARMGVGPAVNPRLIETHMTGYGWTGPYAKRPGIDPLAQALMGMSRAQGGPENPPVFPAQLAPTDYTNGAMGAFGTILALFARARSGIVQRVDSDLLAGGIVLSSAWFTRYAGKPERPLADKDQYGLSPFHRLYRVRDGWIYIVAETDAERRALCTAFGFAMPEPATLAPAPGRHPNATPFAVKLAEVVAQRSVAEALAALRAAGVPCTEAPPADSAIFLDDPHAAANAWSRCASTQGRQHADRLAAGPVRRHASCGRPADATAGRAYGPGAARDRLQRSRDPRPACRGVVKTEAV